MLDIHMIHLLSNGVKYYKADRRLFDPLFYNFADSMKERLFNELNRKPVNFDVAFLNRKAGGTPLIVVQNDEQVFPNQALADASGVAEDSFGRRVRYSHIFTSQTATITVFAESIELARALQVIIRSSILLFTGTLIKAGYENILYQGSTSIGVDPTLMEGGTPAYTVSMSYSALHHHIIPVYLDHLSDVGAPIPDFPIDVLLPTLIEP